MESTEKINIIGFSGKIGVGKNYLSENIIGRKLYELGYHVHFVGYGDFVKYEVGCRLYKSEQIDNTFIDQLNQIFSDLFVNKKKETRRILQLYGTEYSRQGGDIVLDKNNEILEYIAIRNDVTSLFEKDELIYEQLIELGQIGWQKLKKIR